MPRPKTPTTIALEAIAKQAGFSPAYARELHRDQGMPLELKPALAWLADRPTPGAGDSSAADLRKERIRLCKAQAEKAELELKLRRGELIARDEVKSDFTAIAQAVRAMLMSMETALPPLLYGKALMEMRGVIHKELYRSLTLLSERAEIFWKQHPQGDKSAR